MISFLCNLIKHLLFLLLFAIDSKGIAFAAFYCYAYLIDTLSYP